MIRLLTILAILIGLSACNSGQIYNEHQELSPNLKWLKKDTREFKVSIQDKSIEYNLSLSFRYVYGYQFQVANVKVTEISPSGKVTGKVYDLKVRDDKGKYIGDAGYDIWDSEHLVESSKKYKESGVYTYVIEQHMPVDPLNFVIEIGLILDMVN